MKIRVAFAVNNNNEFEAKHFGDAEKYVIYQWDGEELIFSSEIINQSKNLDESHEHGSKVKGNSIIASLKEKGVQILVSKQFGKNIKMVNKFFIPVIISINTIEDACAVVSKNMRWFMEDLNGEPEYYKLFNLRSGTLKLNIERDE